MNLCDNLFNENGKLKEGRLQKLVIRDQSKVTKNVKCQCDKTKQSVKDVTVIITL